MLHHRGSLLLPPYPHLLLYAASFLRAQRRLLCLSGWDCKFCECLQLHTYRPHIYIHRVGSTTTQGICRSGCWSWHHCHGCDENGKYIVPRTEIEVTTLASVLNITPPRLPNVTILPTSACPCGSLPERSVPTTTILFLSPSSLAEQEVDAEDPWWFRGCQHSHWAGESRLHLFMHSVWLKILLLVLGITLEFNLFFK